MPAMDATFYADCEIIIKAFEKGAAFSHDPKSVYAVNTAILSKGIANANNIDKQIGIQFENVDREKLSVGINEPGLTAESISNQAANEATASAAQKASQASQREDSTPPINSGTEVSQDSNTPYTDETFKGLEQLGIENCIPCKDRFAGAEMAITNFGKSWEDYGKLWEGSLESFIKQLEQMVNMLKDRGRSNLHALCEFIEAFNILQCPSDLMRIIAALSAGLMKISIDIFGDLGAFFGLAKGILGSLLSAAVQLMQSFIQRILDPIHCIIDSFQKEFIGPVADMLETVSNLQGSWELGVGVSSSWKDQDWSLNQVDSRGPEAPSDSVLDNVTFGTASVLGERLASVQPFKTEPKEVWSAVHSQPDTGSYKKSLKTEAEIAQLESSKPKPGSKEHKRLKAKKEEYKAEKFDRGIKYMKDFNTSIDRTQGQFQNVFEATFTHLTNIASYIENLFASWVEELSRLIGGTAVVDLSFFGKGVQKLSLITLIGTMTALFEFISNKEVNCDSPSDVLENIIQESYSGMTDAIVKKEEDGTLTVLFGMIETDVETSNPSPIYSFGETGDEEMDKKIEDLANQIQEPAPAITFNCRNAIPQNADANQINKWIAELEVAGI